MGPKPMGLLSLQEEQENRTRRWQQGTCRDKAAGLTQAKEKLTTLPNPPFWTCSFQNGEHVHSCCRGHAPRGALSCRPPRDPEPEHSTHF